MLQISSQPAILSWNRTPGRLDLEGNGELVLDIETRTATLELQTTKPQVTIDQTEPFGEVGMKNLSQVMQDMTGYAKQKMMQGIARRVDQGRQMLDVHKGGNPVSDQAIYNAYTQFEKQFGFGMIPLSKPRIDVQAGEVEKTYHAPEIINRTQVRPLSTQYVPWNMEYFMKQYHHVDIQYTPDAREWVV